MCGFSRIRRFRDLLKKEIGICRRARHMSKVAGHQAIQGVGSRVKGLGFRNKGLGVCGSWVCRGFGGYLRFKAKGIPDTKPLPNPCCPVAL